VSHEGRDGKEGGVGSGFIVSSNGLIATSLHVIGEARPITVHLANENGIVNNESSFASVSVSGDWKELLFYGGLGTPHGRSATRGD
jgi:S1-C subfamily serine protease